MSLTRRTVNLGERDEAALAWLVEHEFAADMTQAIGRALRLAQFINAEIEGGAELAFIKDGQTERVRLL